MTTVLQASMPYDARQSNYEKTIPIVNRLEREIWFGKNVAQQIRDSDVRGQSGTAGVLEVRFYTIAGRTMITIVDTESGHWVSLVVAEDSKSFTMGLHARSTPINMTICFIEYVINNWEGIKTDTGITLDVIATLPYAIQEY